MSNSSTIDGTGSLSELSSKFGTITAKAFKPMLYPRSSTMLPSGVWGYKRVELRSIIPQLGNIMLDTYYKLRIACCGYLMVNSANRLEDCMVCRDNHGYVCPMCLGATWLSTGELTPAMVRCHICCYDTLDDKGKLITRYDADRELAAVNRWLTARFPFGVPKDPTPDDLRKMDGM